MQISIVMPVFNAEKWISDTISSILAQSFSDWELICIDDFSTDESAKMIAKFENIDQRIRLFSNTKKGIIPALQLGLSLSKGGFVTRMDADDLMPKDRLQRMHDALIVSDPKTIVTGKVDYFSEDSVSEGYLRYQSWLNERITNNDHFDHIFRECVIASPNWLARTDELRALNIFENLRYPEDYDMVFQWKAHQFSIVSLNEITLLWREHPERTSRNSEVYDQDSFFELKLNWFLKLHSISKPIGILGAGTKGKITAEFFIEKGIPFNWYDFNSQKYPAPLLGQSIHSYTELHETQVLIAIYPKDLDGLNAFLEEKGYEVGRNAWFL